MAWPFRTVEKVPEGYEMVNRLLVTTEDNEPVAMTLMKRGEAEVVIDGVRYKVAVERLPRKRKQLAIEA